MITNDFYLINADPRNDFLFIKVKGYWDISKKELLKGYPVDIGSEIKKFNGRSFNVLADHTEMYSPHLEIICIHVEAQKVCIANGMIKTAEIFNDFDNTALSTKGSQLFQ